MKLREWIIKTINMVISEVKMYLGQQKREARRHAFSVIVWKRPNPGMVFEGMLLNLSFKSYSNVYLL